MKLFILCLFLLLPVTTFSQSLSDIEPFSSESNQVSSIPIRSIAYLVKKERFIISAVVTVNHDERFINCFIPMNRKEAKKLGLSHWLFHIDKTALNIFNNKSKETYECKKRVIYQRSRFKLKSELIPL